MNKRVALGIGAGVAAFGAVVASAASLGGITTTDLGANTEVVAACDTVGGIDADYVTAFSGGEYKVTGVRLSNVDLACLGQAVKVTLMDGSDASLGEATGVSAPALPQTFTFATPASAEAVEGVAVVISG